MPKLYCTPTSCGAASFIAAKRGGVNFDVVEIVDLPTHTLVSTGEDYYQINSKGNVPSIVFEDKSILNENVGTLYWIGKNSKKNNLLGKSAKDEFQVVNLLGFLASEVHSTGFSPLFRKPEGDARNQIVTRLTDRLNYLVKTYLANGRKYLIGDDFTVADAYLYIMLTWAGYVNFNLPAELSKYKDTIGSLDFVKESHAELNKLQETLKAKRS